MRQSCEINYEWDAVSAALKAKVKEVSATRQEEQWTVLPVDTRLMTFLIFKDFEGCKIRSLLVSELNSC